MKGTIQFRISLLLYVLASALTGAAMAVSQEGSCGRMGQLRCDDAGRHVDLCTRSGTWSHVHDCGVEGALCVEGRCVADPLVTRAVETEDKCVPKAMNCSRDCHDILQCSTNNNWVAVGVCPTGTLCLQGICVNDTEYVCGSENPVTCGYGTVGHFFPNLEDCSSYFACTKEWSLAKTMFCKEGYFDPCSSSKDPCTLVSDSPCKKYDACETGNAGLDTHVWSNPSKYYTCSYDGSAVTTVWKKCDVGYYDDKKGECVGEEYVCGQNSNIDETDEPTSDNDSGSDTEPDPDPLTCSMGDRWSIKDDECHFYHCYSAGNVIVMTCNKNTKYSNKDKGCVYDYGSCTN